VERKGDSKRREKNALRLSIIEILE
jgi:hypothetical protein